MLSSNCTFVCILQYKIAIFNYSWEYFAMIDPETKTIVYALCKHYVRRQFGSGAPQIFGCYHSEDSVSL